MRASQPFAPSIDRSRALLPSFQWLIRLPSAQSFWFLRMVATSPRTGMIIPARWVYIHPWMSSGTVHFPAILVTVTCNPRRCVRTPLSGRERKDVSEQPPRFQTQESTFPYEHSVHVSVRGRVKGSPLLRISPLILDRSSEGSPRFIAVLTH